MLNSKKRKLDQSSLPIQDFAMPRFQVVVADFVTDVLQPERGILGDIAEISALNAQHGSGYWSGRLKRPTP